MAKIFQWWRIKRILGTIMVVGFFALLWGPYIGGFILSVLRILFPDQWIDPAYDIFYKIYPGLLEQHECVSDYMGGCN